MGDLENETDSQRLARLEREIELLRARIDEIEPARPKARSERVMKALAIRRASTWAFRGEQWTGRVGVALLFLGLVFLFRYSVEQGWITPGIRVLFGAILGSAFLAAGLRVGRHRPSYAAILLGAALSTFYATGWAASYLYQLVGKPVALAWMTAVTILAFALSRRYRQPALGTLAALAGFATPFLLRPGSETVVELVAYTSLVVIWSTALYVTHRWRTVLWTYLLGGLGVLSIAAGMAAGGGRVLVQLAIVLTWAAGAYLPFHVEQRAASGRNPHPRSLVPFAIQLRLLGAGGSATAIALTGRLWNLDDPTEGLIFIGTALVYAAFAWIGTRSPSFIARSAAPVGAALIATSTFLILPEGAARWAAVALVAAASIYAGSFRRFEGVQWVAHGLFALVIVSILRAAEPAPREALDPLALAHLFALGLAATTTHLLASARVRLGYRVTTHILLLVWLYAELTPLSAASEWVTVGWGTYGILLVVASLSLARRRHAPALGVQAFGGSALALAVGKILVIDMAQVSPLVRIPLFIGSGLALLLLSPLFQRGAPGLRRPFPEPGADIPRKEALSSSGSGPSNKPSS